MAVSARSILLIWIVIAAASSPASGTCVLDSDFGFTLNCGFKQSGLFRVRNLGGVKGYFGLGFSVGDELGFKQSLSNVEGNRRRSTQGAALGSASTEARSIALPRTTYAASPLVQTHSQSLYAQGTQPSGVLPPFKPIPVSSYPTRSSIASNSSAVVQGGAVAAAATIAASKKRSSTPSPDVSASVIRTVKAPTLVAVPVGTTTRVLPAFQALPQSISRTSDAAEDFRTSLSEFIKMPTRGVTLKAVAPPSMETVKISAVNPDSLSTRTLASSDDGAVKPTTTTKLSPSSITQSMEAIAKASNVSVQTVASAIAAKLKRRQQALEQAAKDGNSGAAATPQAQNAGVVIKKQPIKANTFVGSRGMVMNAPREYYPVGYDKDFDDGFAARVDLPDTSFSCGQQKHFPGLYADEDLGCMVFHVCALTDDGLVMKSFLCPESTLFDQTILKCNWWFYVDCKSSKKLYDSNIPVSKSYQLMKALAFFSSYKS